MENIYLSEFRLSNSWLLDIAFIPILPFYRKVFYIYLDGKKITISCNPSFFISARFIYSSQLQNASYDVMIIHIKVIYIFKKSLHIIIYI